MIFLSFFSHKDESSLETNEQIKRNCYQKAFWDFAKPNTSPSSHPPTDDETQPYQRGGTEGNAVWSQHIWSLEQRRAQSISQTSRNPIPRNPSLPKLP